MSWFVGLITGAAMTVFFVASMMAGGLTLSECRAANPGFDCQLGWVVGRRFE